MSKSIALKLGHSIEVTATGLQIPPNSLTKENWQQVSSQLSRIGVGYHWWIADLAAYARHYLEEPEKALDDLANLINSKRAYVGTLASAGKAYTLRDRVEGLSMGHHVVVMKLPHSQRQKLLRLAKAKGWSSGKLYDKATPKEKRTFKVILRVPQRYKNDAKFKRALGSLKVEFGCVSFVAGEVRKSSLRTARIPVIG